MTAETGQPDNPAPVDGTAVGVIVPRPLKGPLDYRVPAGTATRAG
jgi:hypothetical protein